MSAVLVDTSIWRKYLAGVASTRALGRLLDDNEVLLHPFVLGELTLGGLSDREVLTFKRLPTTPILKQEDVLGFITERRLSRKGIGWVDAHLLASALVTGTRLWSADRALAGVARTLGVDFSD